MSSPVCVEMSASLAELIDPDRLMRNGRAYLNQSGAARLTLTPIFQLPETGGWCLTVQIRGVGSDSCIVMLGKERVRDLIRILEHELEEAEHGEQAPSAP